jgi:Cof subfamily protein (haloacid dehalogenase superfamily)
MDYTLLNAAQQITPATARAIAGARQRGIIFAYATARPLRATEKYWPVAEPDYVIASNGAVLATPGDGVISRRRMEPQVKNDLVAELMASGAVSMVSVETGEEIYIYAEEEDDGIWGPEWRFIRTDFSDVAAYDAVDMSFSSRDDAKVAAIMAHYPTLYLVPHAGMNWTQILQKGVCKEQGLMDLTGRLGIGMGQVVAFGDNHNDVGMLSACGLGVAVENAIEEAAAAAKARCGHHDADGVAAWIEAHILPE